MPLITCPFPFVDSLWKVYRVSSSTPLGLEHPKGLLSAIIKDTHGRDIMLLLPWQARDRDMQVM